jgi:hypothetical protein
LKSTRASSVGQRYQHAVNFPDVFPEQFRALVRIGADDAEDGRLEIGFRD